MLLFDAMSLFCLSLPCQIVRVVYENHPIFLLKKQNEDKPDYLHMHRVDCNYF